MLDCLLAYVVVVGCGWFRNHFAPLAGRGNILFACVAISWENGETMKTRILILAGGLGSRMGADVPKTLVPICGRPIIDHLMEAIVESGVDEKPGVIIGHDLEALRTHLGNSAECIVQEKQLGTGHAVMVAREAMHDVNTLMVTYGDHPLFGSGTFRKVANSHAGGNAVITMITVPLPDYDDWRAVYTHFGRILRNAQGDVEAIKEYRHCDEEERNIGEVNCGLYCFDGGWLWSNIDKLAIRNDKGEYYLTDLIALALDQGERVETVHCSPEEGIGVNTPEEVAIAEKVLCGK